MGVPDEMLERSVWLARQMRRSADGAVAQRIADLGYGHEDYEGKLEDLGIHAEAWAYITGQEIDPKLVFAHPLILRDCPQASLHYRGAAALPYKSVERVVSGIKKWEREDYARQPDMDDCVRLAALYNMVISTIIMDSDGWTRENGYRNTLATIGITSDGMWRNLVGSKGEKRVKSLLVDWLKSEKLIPLKTIKENQEYILSDDSQTVRMLFSSEPDVSFERKEGDKWVIAATIEIKSGTDPAGALERLGAIQKSFEETPARSRNFLVLGVKTKEMSKRLKGLDITPFDIQDILDGDGKRKFINDVFHFTLKFMDKKW